MPLPSSQSPGNTVSEVPTTGEGSLSNVKHHQSPRHAPPVRLLCREAREPLSCCPIGGIEDVRLVRVEADRNTTLPVLPERVSLRLHAPVDLLVDSLQHIHLSFNRCLRVPRIEVDLQVPFVRG